MKKLSILFAFALLMAFLPSFIPHPVFAMTGSGTSGDPYVIYNCTDLQNIQLHTGSYYVLNNSIDCSCTQTWNWDASRGVYEGYRPISTFSGNFNGNNFTISSLYMDWLNTYQAAGLFAQLGNGAVIQDIRILDADITNTNNSGSGGNFVGVLVGNIPLYTQYISRVIVSGEVHCTLVSSSNTAAAGGLIGMKITQSMSSNCHIDQCAAYVDVNLYATGFWVKPCAGGFIGWYGDGASDPDSGHIYDCYARGDVTAYGTGYPGGAGGFVGLYQPYSGSLRASRIYSTGVVGGSGSAVTDGGLVGKANGCAGITGTSFWDLNTSGQPTSACGTGKSTSEMKTQSTFTDAGWDFVTIWGIGGLVNDGYPYFDWWYNPPTIISDVNQVVWFQPNDIIDGNTLPNRAQGGIFEDGNFLWGANPAGVDIEMSEFYSDSQYPVYNYTLPNDAMAPSQDMLGPTGNPGWTPDFPSNAGNPFYPIVNLFAGFWNVAIGLLWPILAWLFIAIMMTLCYRYAPHQMITLFIGGGLAVFFYFWGIIPGWSVFVFVGMGLAIVIGERSPTVS